MNFFPLRDDGRPMFKSKIPRFFKIILDDALRDGKLHIPKKFVRLYGNNLPSSVVLKVPSGAKWKLDLVKSEGEIWFQKGWQEFVNFYSIAYRSFLVFEYNKEKSKFNVTIFDTSASEIDYPLEIANRNNEQSLPEKEIHEETESAASVEILDHKTKGKSPVTFPQPPNKKIKLEKSAEKGEGNRAETLTPQEKAEALKRAASNFKSRNPFFMVAMQPTHLHRHDNYRLSIPASFAKKYFNKQQGRASLSIDGNLWPIEYKCHVSHGRLNKGWKEFAIRNHLEIRDVCVFELINPTKLKVAIFRHIKEAIKSPSLGNNKKMKQEVSCGDVKTVQRHLCSNFSKAVEAANKFTSVNPFFKVNISSYLRTVSLPFEFALKWSKKSGESVWLQIGNRKWPVKLIINRSSYYHNGFLSAEFSLFARENSLKAGDVCIFELINSELLLLKVTVFRNTVK